MSGYTGAAAPAMSRCNLMIFSPGQDYVKRKLDVRIVRAEIASSVNPDLLLHHHHQREHGITCLERLRRYLRRVSFSSQGWASFA